MTQKTKSLLERPEAIKMATCLKFLKLSWIEYQHFKGVTKSIVELLNLISLQGFTSKDGLYQRQN